MAFSPPRSPCEKVGGIVFFGRLIDKIRLHLKGELPADYNFGVSNWYFFDARCTRFLGVGFDALVARVKRGGSDETLLRWCFKHGRKPSEEDIEIWNTFMLKRGMADAVSAGLEEEKRQAGLGHRKDIRTFFELIDAEEGR
jgi:gluconokinase